MKKRITALLLCCVMLLTLCPGLISTATAYDDTQPDQAEATGEIVQPTVNFTDVAPFLPPVSGGVPMLRTASFAAPRAAANYAANDAANFAATDNGMKISKTATPNADGSYTITLEAYATGSKVISEIKEDVPTDIVLVLDQSGSMANDIGTVSFEQYKDESDRWGNITYHTRNQDYYKYRHNGGSANLWHKLSDGSYVSVSVTAKEKISYSPIDTTSSYNGEYWDNRNNLYARVNGEYVKVNVKRTEWYGTYTYTLSTDGSVIGSGNGYYSSPVFHDIDGNQLYLAGVDENNTVYIYTYTDKDRNVQTIGTSTGATTVFSPTLYERVTSTSGGGTRLDALKNAVNNFASAVHTKSLGKDGQVGGGDDIDHRIALVGFSSPDYNNTELLTGSVINKGESKGTDISTNDWYGYYYFPTGYEMNGPQYGSISDAQYKAALLAMNTDAGLSGVTSGVNALTAWGGTRTDNGIAMANKIFEQNPIPNGEKRNRVVIVFTDGIPGLTGYDSDVASSAITQASTAKSTYGATVYTIGIFSGADATSAGSTGYNSSDADKGNYFLQRVSSNTQYPQSPSYYLSAADSASLNNIFQQISDQIETGGSSSTLTASAVVKDIISPQFTLPDGATVANITLETYKYKGPSFDATNAWERNPNAMGAAASIGSTDESNATTTNNQVSVSGFNFSENWCGSETNADGSTTYHGNKLVISFKVTPRPGFLGGNRVITNTNAGIYENATAENPVLTFEQPNVDVTIGDISVSNVESNVYLGGYYSVSIPAEQIKTQMTATCGGVTLDLTKENFGLEEWQYEYVDIAVTVMDAAGNDLTGGIESLTEDVVYTVTITVTPKTTEGSATEQTGSGTDTIHVFKPELTFKDGEVYYGDTAPTNYNSYKVSEKWKHGDKYSTDKGVSMLNNQPTLALSYTPGTGIDKGIINITDDIPVAVTAQIGSTDVTSHVTFKHDDCVPVCEWNEATSDGAFLLHVKTCTLTIKKLGCEDANQSFIFDVTGPKTMQVTVQENGTAKIVGLPVGTYTVTEDGNWSWRYTAQNTGDVTLNAVNHDAEVTITNDRTATKWLSGDNYAVNHVGGIKARGTFVAGN